MEQSFDFLIIGSGFGGSVSAMRLAEKGYTVVVLEAGKRWRPEDFPKSNWNLPKFLWAPALGCYGLQRIRLLKDFMALGGAGVGGGSLNYGCVLMEPLDPFYKDPQWVGLDEDWKVTLAPHYRTAKKMLGVATTPKAWRGDLLLKEYSEEIGRGEHYRPTDVGIFFLDEAGKTVPDPYFDGEGPERTSCDFSAGCMVGCAGGGKNTLDKNYLYFAEKKGAVVVPETLATAIRQDGEGGYLVSSRRSTAWLPRGRKTWKAKNVVLSAGALASLDLLYHCKHKKMLPEISDRLGSKFRTNSEVICGIESRDKNATFAEGVAIASYVQVNEKTSIEAVRYNEGSDAMGGLSSLLVDNGNRLTRPLKWLLTCLLHPFDFLRSLKPWGWAKRTLILLVMQVLDNSLKINYGRSWLFPWRRVLRSKTPNGGIPTFIPEANHCARAIADKCNAIPSTAITEVVLNRPLTAHVMGGCSMADGPEKGVVDKHGRVFGYKGLYVADGSIISANLGVNPSLTITALAEHVMSAIPAKAPVEQDDGEKKSEGAAA